MANRSNLAMYQVENAVKVTDALTAYLNGCVDPIIHLCAETVVWRSVAEPEHAPFGGTFYGRAGVRQFFDAMYGAFDIFEPRVVDVIPARDEVIHVLKLEARRKDGSSEGAAFIVGRWRFKDGLAVSYTDYFNVAAAIQTSTPSRLNDWVTRDPSFAVYENDNAIRLTEMLAAYRGGRTGLLFAMLHPDVAWRSLSEPQHAIFGGLFRGHEAVRTYFKRLSETVVLDEYFVTDVIPAGRETVHVAEVHAHTVAEPKRSVVVRLVCFWTFENGLVTAMDEYFDVPSYWAQLRSK